MLARRDEVKADLDAFVAASDADLAPLLHEALQSAVSAYEIAEGARRPSRFPRSPDQDARSHPRRRRRAGRAAAAASLISSSTSSRTPTRSRPKSSCCSLPTIRARPTGARARPVPESCSWSAIPSSRSTASAAPTLPSTRTSKRDCSRRTRTPAPHHELPQPAFASVVRQRGLCAGDGRERRMTARPPMFRCDLAARDRRAARRSSRCRSRALRRLRKDRQLADRGVAARRRRRVHRLARERERLDG